MDTATPSSSHVLSGHNPTLFNVVVQYADMDMLRALVLTSQSMYWALQKCHFNHLTMVVLEASILEDEQQVVYNGADPVPYDTFRVPLDGAVAALVETTPSAPPPQTQSYDCVLPYDTEAFDTWLQHSIVRNNYDHGLVIPDYARDLMARAQSVELVVYPRRLGSHISAFFTDNAHHLKYGQHTTLNECRTCVESDEPTNTNTQYRLHSSSALKPHTQHRSLDGDNNDDGEHGHRNNVCIFSKHPSDEDIEGDVAESRLSKFHMTPTFPRFNAKLFPYEDLHPLRLNFIHDTTEADLEKVNRNTRKRKHHTRDFIYRDGYCSISASSTNTDIRCLRLQNLPLVEHDALTKSLKIHIVDCVAFGVEDWRNTMPGCTIQPLQTWIIRDDANAPQHPYHPANPVDYAENPRTNNNKMNIAPHFPHLTSLVLQYTPLNNPIRCGIDGYDAFDHFWRTYTTRLSQFFIDRDIRLPHLQHFGVIGKLLDFEEYASLIFHNARVSSLYIGRNPKVDNAYMGQWIDEFANALDRLEDSSTPSPSDVGDRVGQEHTATNSIIQHEDDDGQYGRPQQPHHEYVRQVETTPRPRRKYNFSFEFANPHLVHCCPDDIYTSPQRELTDTRVGAHVDTHDDIDLDVSDLLVSALQRRQPPPSIRDSLVVLYLADKYEPENDFKWVLPEPPSLHMMYPLSSGVRFEDVLGAVAIAKLARRTLTCLDLRQHHYYSHTNPGSTTFLEASPDDCTATHLPPSTNALSGAADLPPDGEDEDALTRMRNIQKPDEDVYMRLRELLRIPSHVVLRL